MRSSKKYPHYEYSWHDPYFHFAIFPKDRRKQPVLSFGVSNLKDAHAQAVAAGAKILSPPKKQPWGYTAAYSDPDGNIVSLVELRERKR